MLSLGVDRPRNCTELKLGLEGSGIDLSELNDSFKYPFNLGFKSLNLIFLLSTSLDLLVL